MIDQMLGVGRDWRDGGMLAGMDGRDGMRAADSDRAAVADRLRVALDEGRLDLHEYDERLQRAYAARTYGDLEVLLTDLPPVTPAQRSGLAPAAGPTVSLLGDQPGPAASQGRHRPLVGRGVDPVPAGDRHRGDHLGGDVGAQPGPALLLAGLGGRAVGRGAGGPHGHAGWPRRSPSARPSSANAAETRKQAKRALKPGNPPTDLLTAPTPPRRLTTAAPVIMKLSPPATACRDNNFMINGARGGVGWGAARVGGWSVWRRTAGRRTLSDRRTASTPACPPCASVGAGAAAGAGF